MAAQPRHVTVYIRTVYEYTPEAVLAVLNAYKGSPKYASNVEAHFDPIKQQFMLEGNSIAMENIFLDFMDIVNKVAADGSKRTESTSPKTGSGKTSPTVTRARNTILNAHPILWTMKSQKPQTVEDRVWTSAVMNSNDANVTINQDLTTSFRQIEFWEPKVSKEDFSLMLNLQGNPTVPDELARVCNCALFADWGKRSVKIGANDPQTMDLVFKKLSKVQETFKRGAAFQAGTAHLVYIDESLRKFEFKLISLGNQREMFRTTLFHNGSKWNQLTESQMFTVRVLAYRLTTEKFEKVRCDIRLISSADKTKQREWTNYKFVSKDPENNIESSVIPRPPDGLGNAFFPANKDPDDYICEFHLPPSKSLNEGASSSPYVSESDGEFRGSVRRPRSRSVKGKENARTGASDGRLTAASSVDGGDSRASSSNQYSALADMAELQEALYSSATASESEDMSVSAAESESPSRGAGGGIILGSRPSGQNINEEQPPLTRRKPKPRGPPALIPSLASEADVSSSEDDYEESTTSVNQSNNARPGFLLGARPSAATVQSSATLTTRKPRERRTETSGSFSGRETVEGTSEVDSRKPINAMRQKAPATPRPKGKVDRMHDGANDSLKLKKFILQRFNDIFAEAFEVARSWSGPLKFEAKLGRIIYADVPKSFIRNSIDWTEFEPALSSLDGDFKTLFTPVMTCEFFDAQFVSDLKLSRDQYLFNPAAVIKNVTYEFHIVQKKKSFRLCIDAENFHAALYGEKKDFGTVNLSCPQRSWDSRFQLTGTKLLDVNVDPYKSILSSFSVVGGGPIPEVKFTLVNMGPEFDIKKIYLKRETRHPCFADKVNLGIPVELSITESQELVIHRNKENNKMFKATCWDRDSMLRDQRIFYTFSIIPIAIEKALKENLHLEVGESAKWTPETIIPRGTWDGLLSIVTTCVRKVDNVGYRNVSRNYHGPVPDPNAAPGADPDPMSEV